MIKLLLAILAFSLLIPSISLAGSNDGTSRPDSILFRAIPWYETEKAVSEAVTVIDGIRPSWYRAVDESARIDGWDRKSKYMYATPNITDGGVMLSYDNATVAGYVASLEVSFMYATVDGMVQYDARASQFYKASYDLNTLEDMEGAYTDLKDKLTNIYGNPQDHSEYSSFNEAYDPVGSLWMATDGSLVYLWMNYNSVNKKYDAVTITYAAPNSNERLNELDAQIKKETAEAENATRESNADNYDGL